MDLKKITDEIDQRHEAQIQKKADAGQLRALELRWRTLVEERYTVRVPDFVGRDREHLRHLWGEFGPGLSDFMAQVVTHWNGARQEKYLDRLSPIPIFREFFTYRAQFVAHLTARKQREERESKTLREMNKYQKDEGKERKKIDFKAMVEAERKKIRDKKG
jgi:hypothetical protein